MKRILIILLIVVSLGSAFAINAISLVVRTVPEISGAEWKIVFPETDNIQPQKISGGSGAKIYKVKVHDEELVVKRSCEECFSLNIRQNFLIQQLMSDLGISPKINYINPNIGIVSVKFIENKIAVLGHNGFRSNVSWSKDIAKLIKKVHEIEIDKENLFLKADSSPIPPSYFNDAVYDYINKELLNSAEQELLQRIINTEVPDGKNVLSHNDLNMNNMLFDGERFWLIDWEFASINHWLYDLAYFATIQFIDNAEAITLLTDYLGHPPNAKEKQDFNDFRRKIHGIFFARTFIMGTKGSRAKKVEESRAKLNNCASLKNVIVKFLAEEDKDWCFLGLAFLREAYSF